MLKTMLEQVGKRLHHERMIRDEKLTALEVTLGISHTVISRIEHGIYPCLSFEMAARLAAHYGLSLQELVSPAEPR